MTNKRKKVHFMIQRFIYSKTYNIGSLQIKVGVSSEQLVSRTNFYDYKTGSSLNFDYNDLQLLICKSSEILNQIYDTQHLMSNTEQSSSHEDISKLKRKTHTSILTENMRVKSYLSSTKGTKIIIQHIYSKQKIQLSLSEFTEFDGLKFVILTVYNNSTQLTSNIKSLYEFYVKKCVEKNCRQLAIEEIPQIYQFSKNSQIFLDVWMENEFNMKGKLDRDISYKKSCIQWD